MIKQHHLFLSVHRVILFKSCMTTMNYNVFMLLFNWIYILTRFPTYPIIYILALRWVTRTLHPSAPPAPLSKFSKFVAQQSKGLSSCVLSPSSADEQPLLGQEDWSPRRKGTSPLGLGKPLLFYLLVIFYICEHFTFMSSIILFPTTDKPFALNWLHHVITDF